MPIFILCPLEECGCAVYPFFTHNMYMISLKYLVLSIGRTEVFVMKFPNQKIPLYKSLKLTSSDLELRMGKEPVFILFSKDHFKYSSQESATSTRFEKQNFVRNFFFFPFLCRSLFGTSRRVCSILLKRVKFNLEYVHPRKFTSTCTVSAILYNFNIHRSSGVIH